MLCAIPYIARDKHFVVLFFYLTSHDNPPSSIAQRALLWMQLTVALALVLAHGGRKEGGQDGPGPVQFLEQWLFLQTHIKVCVICCWQCPMTSAISAAHLTLSLCLCCGSRSNTRGESRAFKGSQTETRELLGGTTENSASLTWGH